MILANHFFELPVAEGFSTGILRLDQSIGVQQKPVTCTDRASSRTGHSGSGMTPNNKPLLSIRSSLPAFPGAQQLRMPSRRIESLAMLRINPQISR
ncbi:MAG: hypothetical protein AUH13_01560 [Acidobacteria bacterium 13_2_20CM_58_27]|nr:MAG: hypothetical protein AUH13_01560 [Acidobacteria bacterium 13_2_20CM_58_27]